MMHLLAAVRFMTKLCNKGSCSYCSWLLYIFCWK